MTNSQYNTSSVDEHLHVFRDQLIHVAIDSIGALLAGLPPRPQDTDQCFRRGSPLKSSMYTDYNWINYGWSTYSYGLVPRRWSARMYI